MIFHHLAPTDLRLSSFWRSSRDISSSAPMSSPRNPRKLISDSGCLENLITVQDICYSQPTLDREHPRTPEHPPGCRLGRSLSHWEIFSSPRPQSTRLTSINKKSCQFYTKYGIDYLKSRVYLDALVPDSPAHRHYHGRTNWRHDGDHGGLKCSESEEAHQLCITRIENFTSLKFPLIADSEFGLE